MLQKSIEDKPSGGSLILGTGTNSEKDSTHMQRGYLKCRTTKDRPREFITGMGEGLEPSDTIVKENTADSQ